MKGYDSEEAKKDGRWRFRFLAPTLSASSFPLPGIEYQPEGATGCRISHPATPPGDWFLPVGSGFLVRRTNLLSPSVTHLPVFKVTLITAAKTKFARVLWERQQLFFRKKFSTGYPPTAA